MGLTSTSRLQDSLVDLVSGFPPSDRCDLTYRVFSTTDGGGQRHVVYADAEQLVSTESTFRVAAMLSWHMNQEFTARMAPTHTVFHAAAASSHGGAVMLAAPMEAGKTTTVAALVGRGFGYMTDEAVPFDPATNRVDDFPKALCLDRGSWHLFPAARPDSAEDNDASWYVQPERLGGRAHGGSLPLSLVILCRYCPGEQPDLRSLTPAAAAFALAQCTFHLTSDPRRHLDAIAHLCRRVPCYSLSVDDLGTAASVIESAMHKAAEAAAHKV